MKSVLNPTRLPELIGKSHDSEMMLSLFKELGIEWSDIRCIDRDIQLYIWESYEKGIQLEFKDEGELVEKSYLDPGDGPFILTCVAFWGGDEDFTSYSGPLPKGIKMTDDQDAILNKAGNPDEQNRFGIWIWYGVNYRMSIRWKNSNKICVIGYRYTPNAER